jgi:IclR family acetate operon transcriptional repressor
MDTAIDKALVILETLSGGRSGRALAEIATETGLPKTTVHRLLSIMQHRGFVDRSEAGGYLVGRKVISLGLAAAEKDSLVLAARPVLGTLVEQTQETVQLGLLQGNQVLYIDRREPADATVRLARTPALLAELHTSAMGKAILAFGREETVEAFLAAPLSRYTDQTVTDPGKLREELEQIRQAGVARADRERYDGVVALGAPVLDAEGYAFAAVSVAGPAHRMDEAKCRLISEALPPAAAELTVLVSRLR